MSTFRSAGDELLFRCIFVLRRARIHYYPIDTTP
jgi:hypothetical protein